LTTIRETQLFDDDTAAALTGEIEKVKSTFKTSDGKLLVGHEEHRPINEDAVSNEQIVVKKKA
ncbi:MAG TPA: F0F1 ATP synthase subunit alpha, partial [Propionibacteriaceae bacterium]|nr:F0F1 ATP synthase subunit alpha [Propionibacteriaceae bacterium]